MNKEQLNIRYIPTDKKQYLSLLLLADEQESMIDRYLERGELYVMLDEQMQEPLAVRTEESGRFSILSA